ncbi:hypothetical protein V8F20_003845 [Naviculisporaceae sp. PSN 640]
MPNSSDPSNSSSLFSRLRSGKRKLKFRSRHEEQSSPGSGNGSKTVLTLVETSSSVSPRTSSQALVDASFPEYALVVDSPPAIPETKSPIINTFPIPSPPRSSSDVRTASEVALTSRPPSGEYQIADDLWSSAYHNLKTNTDTANLVSAYEKILTSMHQNGNGGEIEIRRLTEHAYNLLDCGARDRLSLMRDMARVSLQRAKKHESVHQGVQQIARFVQTTSVAVNSMLSAYPPAAIAWAGICAILPVIAVPSSQRLAMSDGLLYVMEKMEWYMTVSQALKIGSTGSKHGMLSLEDLAKSKTILLLQTLLEFEIKAVCSLYDASPLVRVVKTVLSIDDWKTLLEDAKKLEREIFSYLSQFSSAVTISTLEQMNRDTSSISFVLRELRSIREQGAEEKQKAEEVQRLELIGRFSTDTTCPYVERMMSVPKRVEGTCEWFQTHEKYRAWLSASDGGLLLLSADPGCGKSVLSRFLIHEVLPTKRPEDIICYFFFKDSPDQNNTPAALCAVIHQILSRNRGLADKVRYDILENGTGLTAKERVLWRILEKLIMEVRRMGSNIIWVLDALDECQREGRLSIVEHIRSELERNVNTLPRASDPPLGKVRILVTTRGYPEIIKLFRGFAKGCILLAGENKSEVEQIQQEIALVVNHKLDNLAADRKLSDKKKQEIRKHLVRKGGQQRTYLWVQLVFEVLESNHLDKLAVWRGIINKLPQTVYDAYDDLLKKVGEMSDKERDRVMMLLRLMIAAFRPLHLRTAILLLNAREAIEEELEEELESDEEDYDEDLELESDESFRSWVLGACGIFITVYDDQLFFIHQTAKEFLQASKKTCSSTPPQGSMTFRQSISEAEAHRTMAESCIALWKYGVRSKVSCGDEFAKHNDEDSGYRYCIELWAQHFREAQVFSDSGGGGLLVQDIHEKLWDTYLKLWKDASFICADRSSGSKARHGDEQLTDEAKLGLIATYGHYRLLDMELGRLAEELAPDEFPCILSSDGTVKECTALLLRHLPSRPVIVVSDYEETAKEARARQVIEVA